MSRLIAVLESAYAVFNARDAEGMRRFIHPDVIWPNTLEPDHTLIGQDAVIAHFTRVFATLRPNIHLIAVIEETDDALTVDAQHAVETDDGQVWSDTRARLTYHFRDGLVVGMTILSGLWSKMRDLGNAHLALEFCFRIVFSENRPHFFRTML